MTTNSNITFEEAYRELGEIVDQLESGELSLDQTLTLYERGRQLIGLCEGQLNAAELKINQLVSDSSGGVRTEPLS